MVVVVDQSSISKYSESMSTVDTRAVQPQIGSIRSNSDDQVNKEDLEGTAAAAATTTTDHKERTDVGGVTRVPSKRGTKQDRDEIDAASGVDLEANIQNDPILMEETIGKMLMLSLEEVELIEAVRRYRNQQQLVPRSKDENEETKSHETMILELSDTSRETINTDYDSETNEQEEKGPTNRKDTKAGGKKKITSKDTGMDAHELANEFEKVLSQAMVLLSKPMTAFEQHVNNEFEAIVLESGGLDETTRSDDSTPDNNPPERPQTAVSTFDPERLRAFADSVRGTRRGSVRSMNTDYSRRGSTATRPGAQSIRRSTFGSGDDEDEDAHSEMFSPDSPIEASIVPHSEMGPAVEANILTKEDVQNLAKPGLRKRMFITIIMLICAIVAVVIGVTVAVTTKKEAITTLAPSQSPTLTPTWSLASSTDYVRSVLITNLYNNSTSAEVLFGNNTAQHQAFEWLTTNRTEWSDGQIVQRYVLAVLYFSTLGPSWKDQFNFLSDIHECDWAEAGLICDENGTLAELEIGTCIPLVSCLCVWLLLLLLLLSVYVYVYPSFVGPYMIYSLIILAITIHTISPEWTERATPHRDPCVDEPSPPVAYRKQTIRNDSVRFAKADEPVRD